MCYQKKKKKELCDLCLSITMLTKNEREYYFEQSFFPNSSYIFILSVNFENLTIRLHVLIIFFILAKF